MTHESHSRQLTDEQKSDVLQVVSSGCDRETAAKYARTTWAAIHAAMADDREFAADVRYKEATVELNHMIKVRKASEKEGNWRASVWWLQTLAPERYDPRGTSLVSARQLKMYLEHVATTLVGEVHDPLDRERLLQKLHHAALTLDQFFRDECFPEPLIDDADDADTDAEDTPASEQAAAEPPATAEGGAS